VIRSGVPGKGKKEPVGDAQKDCSEGDVKKRKKWWGQNWAYSQRLARIGRGGEPAISGGGFELRGDQAFSSSVKREEGRRKRN